MQEENYLITSTKNPKIKQLLLLQEKSKERATQGLFVIEGLKEVKMALEAGYRLHSVYVCPELSSTECKVLINNVDIDKVQLYYLSKEAYQRIAYRQNVEGIVAAAYTKKHAIESLKISENPLIIIAEGVEKPGNIGAILRTADAAKVDAVILCDVLSDLYNPNVIRSSVGCFFTVQTAVCKSEDVIKWLTVKQITAYSLSLAGKKYYHECNFTTPTALVLGTESTGLTSKWSDAGMQLIKIPMLGKNDSLNVSVSAAIVTYEAKRQRGFLT